MVGNAAAGLLCASPQQECGNPVMQLGTYTHVHDHACEFSSSAWAQKMKSAHEGCMLLVMCTALEMALTRCKYTNIHMTAQQNRTRVKTELVGGRVRVQALWRLAD